MIERDSLSTPVAHVSKLGEFARRDSDGGRPLTNHRCTKIDGAGTRGLIMERNRRSRTSRRATRLRPRTARNVPTDTNDGGNFTRDAIGSTAGRDTTDRSKMYIQNSACD